MHDRFHKNDKKLQTSIQSQLSIISYIINIQEIIINKNKLVLLQQIQYKPHLQNLGSLLIVHILPKVLLLFFPLLDMNVIYHDDSDRIKIITNIKQYYILKPLQNIMPNFCCLQDLQQMESQFGTKNSVSFVCTSNGAIDRIKIFMSLKMCP